MYIERIKRKHKNKNYVTTLIRESYRDGRKVKHRTVANISKLPEDAIKSIEAYFANPLAKSCSASEIKIEHSREYGASKAFMELAQQLNLDKIIYSRKEEWRQDILAMIIGRLVYQGSKLHLCHLHQDSAVWNEAGYENGEIPDVNKHCYSALDNLLRRQPAIQKELAKRHLSDGCLVLYDITSSYLEGEYEDSDIVAFGYSRDNKRKHEQIVIGLLANAEGCPIAIEVFRGNTSDQTTVLGQAKKLAELYKVKDVVFVGDRGMLTPKRIEEVNSLGYKMLTAMTHAELKELRARGFISSKQFQENEITELVDQENKKLKYFLCKNPDKERESKETRRTLIRLTVEGLEKIKTAKKRHDEQKSSARVGKILAKYKVGKFFNWFIKDGELSYQIDENKILLEEEFDGCYVVKTDSELLRKEEAVSSYKGLAVVERAFRNIKTMSLEIRPIYHHLDDRIRAHVFLCMLAYYLEWHAMQRLQTIFATDGKGKKRRFSFEMIIERLKSIRIQDCSFNNVRISGLITTPDHEQQKILDLLKTP